MANPENIEPYKFKPGQSGNPNGRPKGAKNFTTILERMLSKETDVEEDGMKLTRQELLCINLISQAVTSLDPKDRLAATKEIIDRVDGKAAQTQINQYQDAEGNSVNVNVTIGGKSGSEPPSAS